MTGEHWMGTFRTALLSSDEKVILSVLNTICKTEYKDGMIHASKIAANFEIEREDCDELCRRLAREIVNDAVG